MTTMPVQKPYRSKQDYRTPAIFLEATMRLLAIRNFTFDYAADAENTVAPEYYSETGDALSLPEWPVRPGWGWLNPPFTKIGPWAMRCRDLGRRGGKVALLVPAAVGSNWFRDYVADQAAVLFLNGRLAFMPDHPTWLYPKDCILALYGLDCWPRYEVWSWKK